MNRKVLKIVSILLMVLLVVSMLSTSVFAADETKEVKASGWSDIDTGMFNNVNADNSGLVSSTTNIVGNIITVIQVVGTGVAIIMLIYMAIKYISAAPSEKAEFKKSATAYIVGAIVLFAASGILGIVKNFATSNIKTSETAQIVVASNEEVA